MPVLTIGIVQGCFYLLIFILRNSQLESDVCRLPFAVNVNLNPSNASHQYFISY